MAVRVERLMGTVIGVDVRDPVPAEDPLYHAVQRAVDSFFAELRALEERFSPWLAGSEVSRIGRGELREEDAAPDVRWVLAACDHLARTSGGAFDARHRDGHHPMDPSGLVKGWAVDEAARHLQQAGLRHYAVNAGGDVLVRGAPDGARAWRVGIRHPLQRDRLAAVLEVRGGAVATSGLYERNDHIRHARTGAVPAELRSMTVAGPELTWADAYATAAFAMGEDGLAWVHDHPGYGALAVTADDRLVWTPTIEPLLMNISGSRHSMVDVPTNSTERRETLEAQA